MYDIFEWYDVWYDYHLLLYVFYHSYNHMISLQRFLNVMMYDMIIICYFISSITHIITWSPYKGNPWKSNGWIQASLGNVNDDVKNDHIYDEC